MYWYWAISKLMISVYKRKLISYIWCLHVYVVIVKSIMKKNGDIVCFYVVIAIAESSMKYKQMKIILVTFIECDVFSKVS